MKKILTAALAVIVAALVLTGCKDNSNNSSSTDQSSSTTDSNNSTSTNDSNSSDDSNSSEDSTSSDETSDPEFGLQYPDNKAGRMVKAALEFNPEEWSMAMSISDDEMLPMLLSGLTADMFEEYCFAFDMIGINGHTVFVGKAKAGQEDAVKSAIEESLNSYKEQVAFYPAGQEAAAGAVNGSTDDGYNYFVIHANGENIAAAMTSAG